MATYSKRGQKYRVRWRNPGDKNTRSYSIPDEQTAREFSAEASRCEARSEPWVPPPLRMTPVAQQDLEGLATDWLRDIRRTARAATISAYGDSVGRFIEFSGAHLGRVPVLTDLTPTVVKAFDANLESRKLTIYTRRARVAAVKSWAGWIESVHPDVFRAAPVKAVKMPRPPKPRPLALPWSEIDAIVREMGGGGGVAAMIARCTGLRRGEVVGLRWGDLETTPNGVVYFNVRDEITKGGRSGRRIPIAPVLARFLQERRSQLGAVPDNDDQIAPITGPSFTVMTTSAIKDAVAKGRCRNSAKKVRSSTHLFRYAFVTNVRRAGADADAVEQLVGHDIGIKRHYLDLDTLMQAAVAHVPGLTSAQSQEASNVIQLDRQPS